MREVTEHRVDAEDASLTITVADEPGAGGANHRYDVSWTFAGENPSAEAGGQPNVTIMFQNGGIKEAGVNGLTHEALLAIVADRLRSFQAGPYPCEENNVALAHVSIALNYLKKRTRARMVRGVEGEQRA